MAGLKTFARIAIERKPFDPFLFHSLDIVFFRTVSQGLFAVPRLCLFDKTVQPVLRS